MFETRKLVLQGSIFSAALVLAGTLVSPGCTGDKGDTGPAGPTGTTGDPGGQGSAGSPAPVPDTSDPAAKFTTATPIKHVVIIFGENVSFDHYFGTYPTAKNLPGETPFIAANGTPSSNNLATPLDVNNSFMPLTGVDLLNNNPNQTPDPNNPSGPPLGVANPMRLAPSQASTADQGHNYKPEQQASHAGAMDLFPQFTGAANPMPLAPPNDKSLVMGYYDGNTVTAMWNYAQHFAMNDNSWTTQFGPSTPGAINLISGQTNGMIMGNKPFAMFSTSHVVADGQGGFTMIGDTDPLNDVCSTSSEQNLMAGKNIGDLLNVKNITWGSFMGGFDLNLTNRNGTFGCTRFTNPTQAPFTGPSVDYIPHHAWFQYYASTANPQHLRPSSLQAVGSSKTTDGKAEPANHNYDSHDFFDALAGGNLPAVNFLKAPAFQDGHAGYSNPIDEQAFIVSVVNALQDSKFWATTAVIIAYDDSDGWYDHQAPPIVNPSFDATTDQLNAPGTCNTTSAQQGHPVATAALPGAAVNMPVNGRCGYGTRIPLMVLSPLAKKNFVDHTLTDQTSVLKFIEDNWLNGQRIQPGASFDTIAGSINGMFDFSAAPASEPPTLRLDARTGVEVAN
ncbi:MAG TPA: alkaline phosphatase family protein [Kofleriaceae bacterium]|jgi:phospholipase C|nr:alkaline phosphatase family protein [Kofleriaceae bacterium]